ncbi:MAG: hypothetical protein AAB511_01050 [Patescibacteria group bacterium]
MTTPSKKILLTASVAIVVIAGLVFFTQFQSEITYTAPVASTATSTGTLEIDTDQDGLRDWEEGLWKTDPINPDTDSDGTEDSAEIKLNRDPLLAGPNDKLDTDTVDNKINPETEADLTDTDKFSRELFVKIIAAGQAENPPTETDFQNFLNSTIQNQVVTQKARSYTSADFSVDNEETPAKIKAYGNALATILKTPPTKKFEYEINIVERAQEKKDPEILKQLEPNISAYANLENTLLKMTVPKSALPVHIALTNGAAGMAWSITGLSYILTDPIKALPGVAGYGENFQAFIKSLGGFNKYFISSKVIFQQNDAGYHFFDAI